MQDKISPSVKQPESLTKPIPKTSHSTQENIIRYLHIHSAHEQLQDVLLIAVDRQTILVHKRHETRQLGSEGEGLTTLSAGEQAETNLQETVQPYVQQEIQSLEELAKLVGATSILARLSAMKFPNLTPEDIQSLDGMISDLNDMSWHLPQAKQYQFWNMEKSMFAVLIATNQGNIASYEQQNKLIQAKIDALKWFYDDMDAVNDLLDSLKDSNGKMTAAQIQQLFNMLTDLKNRYPSLQPDQKAAVDQIFKSISLLKNQNGVPLTEMFSEIYLEKLIQQYCQAHPNTNHPMDLMDWLEGQVNAFSDGGIPFFNDIKQQMHAIVYNSAIPGFPFTAGKFGCTFAHQGAPPNGYIEPTDMSTFWEQISDATTISTDSITNATKNFQTAYNAVLAEHQALQDQINSNNLVINSLGELNRSFAQAIAAASAMFEIIPGSLPDDFRHAILDHYMPQQEELLRSMAEILYFNNMGAEMGNKLLYSILGFADAGTKFDFGHSLTKDDTGQYVGDPSQAKARLADEQAEARADFDKVQNALNLINQQLKDIDSDQQLTPAQKGELRSKLESYAGNLKAAQSQLTDIKKILDNISVTDQGAAKGHFVIVANDKAGPDWQTNLAKFETIVVHGDNDATGFKGGLINIDTQISDDQKNYSDQGQQQQMRLQLTMTEIQQEWSIVSTAIQLLNQMYMVPAQGIYK